MCISIHGYNQRQYKKPKKTQKALIKQKKEKKNIKKA